MWYEDRYLANALVLRHLGDCWPCATCCWVSCLVLSALHDLTGVLEKFCVPSLVRPISCVSAQLPFGVLIEPAPDLFKLGLNASNAAYQRELFMARDVARAASSAGSAASDGASSDEDLPGHSNMWCSLLEAAYHHSIGAFLAMNMCHSSMAALSQSCHFAVFVNLVARSSNDEFFTLCDVHSEHERTTQAACLQRRHE